MSSQVNDAYDSRGSSNNDPRETHTAATPSDLDRHKTVIGPTTGRWQPLDRSTAAPARETAHAVGMDHTSGAQAAAEHEATAEQRALWYGRLRGRVDELAVEVRNLGIAATAHGTAEALVIAINAREAAGLLQRAGEGADYEVALRKRLAHHGDGSADRPPFAAELEATSPPHEDTVHPDDRG